MPYRSFNPLFWTLAQIGSRARSSAPAAVEEVTLQLPEPKAISVPTRHGDVRVFVQEPADHAPTGAGRTPSAERNALPVVVQLHGGGFVNRDPGQDRHIARHLAAHLGAVVVLPDYDTAPQVTYPVAEEEVFDIVRWVTATGPDHGWDRDRVILSGVSAGAKLAVNACQQLRAAGEAPPMALILVVPVTDVVRTDRTSPIRRPAISPRVQRLVAWAYFPDSRRRNELLASPRLDPALAAAMPPTLVLTAQNDTLAAEGVELVNLLRSAGSEVDHYQYPGADHGFIAAEPLSTVRDALQRMVAFLRPRLGPAA